MECTYKDNESFAEECSRLSSILVNKDVKIIRYNIVKTYLAILHTLLCMLGALVMNMHC